jgi:hypothetical protein
MCGVVRIGACQTPEIFSDVDAAVAERARTIPQLAGLSFEATYDLWGHGPSMQCAACTIDLTTAGKGYAATGRQTLGTGTRRHHHPPGPPAPGPTPGRKNWRCYALITAARKPRVTRPLLPAPRALMQAAGPEESRRRWGRFGQ